jgi:hypothetical protein
MAPKAPALLPSTKPPATTRQTRQQTRPATTRPATTRPRCVRRHLGLRSHPTRPPRSPQAKAGPPSHHFDARTPTTVAPAGKFLTGDIDRLRGKCVPSTMARRGSVIEPVRVERHRGVGGQVRTVTTSYAKCDRTGPVVGAVSCLARVSPQRRTGSRRTRLTGWAGRPRSTLGRRPVRGTAGARPLIPIPLRRRPCRVRLH